jgi:hypothetical protein
MLTVGSVQLYSSTWIKRRGERGSGVGGHRPWIFRPRFYHSSRDTLAVYKSYLQYIFLPSKWRRCIPVFCCCGEVSLQWSCCSFVISSAMAPPPPVSSVLHFPYKAWVQCERTMWVLERRVSGQAFAGWAWWPEFDAHKAHMKSWMQCSKSAIPVPPRVRWVIYSKEWQKQERPCSLQQGGRHMEHTHTHTHRVYNTSCELEM